MSKKSGAFDGLWWVLKGIYRAIAAILRGFMAVAKYFILAIDSVIHEDKRW